MRPIRTLAVVCVIGTGLALTVPLLAAASGPPPTFVAAAGTVAGVGSSAMTSVDIDHDARPDVLVVNTATRDVSVRLGDGSGGFSVEASVPVGLSPFAITTGDFNRDGDVDFAVSCPDSGTISVLLGEGSGSFAAAQDIVALDVPYGLVAADFDRDGKTDLVTGSRAGASRLAFLHGNGDGTFQAPATIDPVGEPRVLAAGDIDRDGALDLVCADASSGPLGYGTLRTYRGDGNGGFTRGSTISVDAGTRGLALADFDRDGAIDVAAANERGRDPVRAAAALGDVSVHLNDGGGAFADAGPTLPVDSACAVAADDVNGDAVPDIVAITGTADEAHVYAGDGAGGFTFGATLSTGGSPAAVAVRDFTLDGLPDVATLDSASERVSLFENTSAISHAVSHPASQTLTGLSGPFNLKPADLDRDGALDLVVGNWGNPLSSEVTVYLSEGGRRLGAPAHYAMNAASTGSGPGDVVVADFDRDGIPDIASANFWDDSVSIVTGEGDGTFAQPSLDLDLAGVVSGPNGIATGDLDRDGILDLVVSSIDTAELVPLIGAGDGTFTVGSPVAVGDGPVAVVIADLDHDAALDIATSGLGATGGHVSVSFGNGDGTFDSAVGYACGWDPQWLDAADADLDGDVDLVTPDLGPPSALTVLYNDGAGGFATTSTLDPLPNGRPCDAEFADVDRDGDADIVAVYEGPEGEALAAGVYANDGAGSFAAPYAVDLGDWGTYVAVADFDRDGRPDIAATCFQSDTARLLLSSDAPVTAIGFAPPVPNGLAGWYVTTPTVTISRDVAGTTYWEWDAPAVPSSPSTTAAAFDVAPPEGEHRLWWFSASSLGVTETSHAENVKLDTNVPETTASDDGAWHRDAFVLALSATDTASGVAATYVATSGTEAIYSEPFDVTAEGTTMISYRSVDVAGNAEATRTLLARIDRVAPMTTSDALAFYVGTATIHLSGTDGTSGLAATRWRIDGGDLSTGTVATTWATGYHSLEFFSIDNAGNVESSNYAGFWVVPSPSPDTVPPVTTIVGVPSGWMRSDVTLTLLATDGSGVSSRNFRLNGGEPLAATGGVFTVSSEGVTTIEYWSVDVFGNSEQPKTAVVRIDRVAPEVTVSGLSAAWSDGAVAVTLTATDAASGVVGVRVSVGEGPATAYSAPVTITAEGTTSVAYWAIDAAGNESTHATVTVLIDLTAPRTELTDLPEGWASSALTLTLNASDTVSGVVRSYYAIDEGQPATYTPAGIGIVREGTTTVTYWSVDHAGNRDETHTATVAIDMGPPETGILGVPEGWARGDVTFFLSATDTGSGVHETFYRVDGGDTVTYTPDTTVTVTAAGESTVEYRSTDVAGRGEDTRTAVVRIDPTRPYITTRLRSYYDRRVTIPIRAADTYSGVARITWRLDGGPLRTAASVTVTSGGRHTLRIVAFDRAGNPSLTRYWAFIVRVPASLTSPVPNTRVVRIGRRYVWSGTLRPRHASGKGYVRLYFERLVRGRWVRWRIVRAGDRAYSSYSRYWAYVALPYAGRWRVRAYHVDSYHTPTWSR